MRVINVSGSAAVYFRTDGIAPTVQGNDTYVLPGVAGAYLDVDVPNRGVLPSIYLISSGTPVVGVLAL